MNVLNAAKPLPVYMQIAELLARQIKAGYWRGDERLPTEAELAQTLGVAIGTLRKGLALLEQQGVLERIQGSGTYVRSGAGKQQIYELFRLALTDGPGFPTARVLELSRQARPAGVPAMGPDGPGACWRVRRLRYLSLVPVALEEIWFDASASATLSPQELGDSMYLFYQQRFQSARRQTGQQHPSVCALALVLATSSAPPGPPATGLQSIPKPGSIRRCAAIPPG